MGIRINQNIMAMNAYRNLSTSEGQLSKSLERLSSGFRINKAADDASGLVISEGLRSQVMGLKMAIRNTQDGVSVVQTAEGALTEVHSLLQRIRELAVQALSTGSSDPDARAAAQAEVSQLISEVDRIATTTRFGGQRLLNGSYGMASGATGGADGTGFTPAVAAEINADDTATTLAALNAHTFGTDENFTVVVDGQAQVITFSGADSFAGDTAAVIQGKIQAKLDAAFGGDAGVTVTLDNTGPNPIFTLRRDSTANGTSVQVLDGVGGLADDIWAIGADESSAVDPAIAGVPGSFASTGGTAVVRGVPVGALDLDYATSPQSFEVSIDGGTTYHLVELDTDLSNAANPVTALQAALNTSLTNVVVGAGTLNDHVDVDVIWGDATGQIQVELRTVATGSSATLDVRAADGPDAGGAADALYSALFGTGAAQHAAGNSGGVFQVGADAGEVIEVSIRDMRIDSLGIDLDADGVADSPDDAVSALDIEADAEHALEIVDAAVRQVSAQRGSLGAIQNRFEHTIANLSVTVENLTASESRIRDTDMAEEMMAFTRAQILQQAGTAMLAQANAVPQSVLELLK